MKNENSPFYIKFLREIILLIISVLSWILTKKNIRRQNYFSWKPIVEVAVLFFGIFVTMCPALILLRENAASFGLREPFHFYYATGALSSFLDNAPTAVIFYNIASQMPVIQPVVAGINQTALEAIALGAVFFGAMTYVGNGPNFMIKAIVDEQRIAMPTFFGYIFKFSLPVLLPIYIVVQLIFI